MSENQGPVTWTRLGPCAVVTIANPALDVAPENFCTALLASIIAAERDEASRVIVILCRGRAPSACDGDEVMTQPPRAPDLSEICARIEACEKPVVCAFQHSAFGASFEIGLAAHMRLAAPDVEFGLPAVRQGLVPGAGGTQRLPRLIGVPAALDLLVSGRSMGAAEAVQLGAIDAIAQGDIVEAAIDAAMGALRAPLRRTGERPLAPLSLEASHALLDGARKKARGQEAPTIAAQLALVAARTSLAEGLAREREEFQSLMGSQQAQALRHIRRAERQATNIPGLQGARPRELGMIGVVGAGVMGSGIALALLDAHFEVVIVERNPEAAESGRSRIIGALERSVASGRMIAQDLTARIGRLTIATSQAALAPCDLVIEAVYDDLDVKRRLFAELSQIVRPDCILATNTSYLDPNAIARDVQNPKRVAGMHFFAPAQIMRLVEAVRTARTSPDAFATILALARKLRKLPIYAGACEGFIGNRMYSFYRRQCEFMLEEGAMPEEIDGAMETWGLPMGPFRAFDLSGLDIAWALRKRQAATRDPANRYSPIADRLCEAGRFGQKTGAGWYRYESGKPRPDRMTRDIIERTSREKALMRRPFTAQEIRLRLVAALANEGAKILHDGIALRAGDIDLVYVNGYGWPAWLGGPMFQARAFGLARILDEVRKMNLRDGPDFAPARLLLETVERGSDIL